MDKPISIVISEAKANIIDVINKQNLSPSILELILKSIYMDIVELERQELLVDKKKYENSIKLDTEERNIV